MSSNQLSSQWWTRLFSCIDARQAASFARLLCEDAVFRYGSNAEVCGRSAIASFVEQFFATLRSCEHRVQQRWEFDDARICHGLVTYTRLDGQAIELPFCNVMTLRGDLILRYEIFIDPTPLSTADQQIRGSGSSSSSSR
jgi:ketosteroid isomerase-like protein